MREPLDNLYFNWLCAKVLELRNPNYFDLLKILHKTEFVVIIPMDKNRAEDGKELRLDFFRETRYPRNPLWEEQPCSIFEFLLAFAKRASFQTNIPVIEWFWIFMTNLNLNEFRRVVPSDRPIIRNILRTFVMRTYSPNGEGGLFPMQDTEKDQREVELWHQFFEWAKDQNLV